MQKKNNCHLEPVSESIRTITVKKYWYVATLKKKYGFTLVELIVTITILAILGTIAFVNIGNFQGSARDGTRASDLVNIAKSLDIAFIKTSRYPDPTSATGVTFSGGVVWSQGTVGDSVVTTLFASNAKLSKKPTDPKYPSIEYTYSVLNTGKEYQIAAAMEESSTVYSAPNGLIEQVYAVSTTDSLTAYIKGNYNGVAAKVDIGSPKTTYVLVLPSIILRDTSSLSRTRLDSGDIIQKTNLVLHKKGNIPSGYTNNTTTPITTSTGSFFSFSPMGSGASLTVGSGLVAYVSASGSLPSDSTGVTTMMTVLQNIYKSSELKGDSIAAWQVQTIINTATGSSAFADLGNMLLKNTLWGAAVLVGGDDQGTTLTCSGNAPTLAAGLIQSSTTPTGTGIVWSYSGSTVSSSWPACTWSCSSGYFQNGNACISQLYVDDVFSAYTYTGNGGTQTINNGIDLAGRGGMVWFKNRGAIGHQTMVDFKWGNSTLRFPNLSTSQSIANFVTYNSNGVTINSSDNVANAATNSYASWTFREAPKFFAEAMANVNSDTTVSFPELGSIGMVIVQGTFGNDSPFWIYHRSWTTGKLLQMNSTAAEATSNAITVSGTDITLHSAAYDGGAVIVYAFAHDTDTTNGMIQEGSYTGNGSATWPNVNLGWEPQYLMVKNTSWVGNWQIIDSTRGFTADGINATLQANISGAESNQTLIAPNATGFQIKSSSSEVNTSGVKYIYMAIRRPNKPPTSGLQVYNAIARTDTTTPVTVTSVGFTPDMVKVSGRYDTGGNPNHRFFDRLRGTYNTSLASSSTNAEQNPSQQLKSWGMDGIVMESTYGGMCDSTQSYIHHYFKRAPGVFDEIAYTGDATGDRPLSHNLGVAPELILVKKRSAANDWYVYHKDLWLNYLLLNSSAMKTAPVSPPNPVGPSGTNLIYVHEYPPYAYWDLNASGNNYIAYLFASKSGISKVGSYTGNGSSQNINANFTASARYILIKRTDVAGDWFVWDTARGINAWSNDPHLSLNTTAAEVTTDNSVDPYTNGFAINQVAATNINLTGATYIYLAFQ